MVNKDALVEAFTRLARQYEGSNNMEGYVYDMQLAVAEHTTGPALVELLCLDDLDLITYVLENFRGGLSERADKRRDLMRKAFNAALVLALEADLKENSDGR